MQSSNAATQLTASISNPRLRYAFAEGTGLWLVYNKGLDMERSRDPLGQRPRFSRARTLLLEYTKTPDY
jgi:hypothetical protein